MIVKFDHPSPGWSVDYAERKPGQRHRAACFDATLRSKAEVEAWVRANPKLELVPPADACPTSVCPRCLEAAEIIQKLLTSVPDGCCADFHHTKADLHGPLAPCPVEERHRSLLAEAREFLLRLTGKPE